MALFRKFFFKKPPDGVLLITDNIYGNGLLSRSHLPFLELRGLQVFLLFTLP
jgi:hypothetical protein